MQKDDENIESITELDCPVCGWKNIKSYSCPQCGTDLRPLIHLKEIPKKLIEKAQQLMELEKWDQALEYLMTSLSLGEETDIVYIGIGSVYLEKKIYNDAIQYYQKALKINPNNEKAKELLRQTSDNLLNIRSEQKIRDKQFVVFKYFTIILSILFVILGFSTIYVLTSNFIIPKERINVFLKENSQFKNVKVDIIPNKNTIQIKGHVSSKIYKLYLIEFLRIFFKDKLIDVKYLHIIPQESFIKYQVSPGETLSSIAYSFYNNGQKWKQIYRFNQSIIKNPHKIYTGQVLRIPLK